MDMLIQSVCTSSLSQEFSLVGFFLVLLFSYV